MELNHCPDAEKLAELTELVLREALRLGLSDEEHRGVFFSVADERTGEPLDIVELGDGMRPAQRERRHALVQEKPRRLARHPEHLASSESRSPERNEWGGAIRANGHILALSGLKSDDLDEAVMLVVARAHGGWTSDLVIRQCESIASRTQNYLYSVLHTNLTQQTLLAMLKGTHVSV